ncbi:MAG: hypothetical protein KGL48_00375 [Sphingomonadales bacterium]|nr:hypothetical protein [Sphingomonadales bacterium]MDE2567895.1 hypothetical protein [Sphingomonadales bacterium]
MTKSRLIPMTLLALMVAAPGAAFAADPEPQASASGSATPDTGAASRNYDKEDMGKGDRVICRKIETIGSRLHAQRICATATQWSAMKQEQREGLEHIQTQRYPGNGG